MLNVLKFAEIDYEWVGQLSWVCLDLGENMKHEVHVLGKKGKKNNVLPKKKNNIYKFFLKKKLFHYLFINFLKWFF